MSNEILIYTLSEFEALASAHAKNPDRVECIFKNDQGNYYVVSILESYLNSFKPEGSPDDFAIMTKIYPEQIPGRIDPVSQSEYPGWFIKWVRGY